MTKIQKTIFTFDSIKMATSVTTHHHITITLKNSSQHISLHSLYLRFSVWIAHKPWQTRLVPLSRELYQDVKVFQTVRNILLPIWTFLPGFRQVQVVTQAPLRRRFPVSFSSSLFINEQIRLQNFTIFCHVSPVTLLWDTGMWRCLHFLFLR